MSAVVAEDPQPRANSVCSVCFGGTDSNERIRDLGHITEELAAEARAGKGAGGPGAAKHRSELQSSCEVVHVVPTEAPSGATQSVRLSHVTDEALANIAGFPHLGCGGCLHPSIHSQASAPCSRGHCPQMECKGIKGRGSRLPGVGALLKSPGEGLLT